MWDACCGLVNAVHNLLRHYGQISIIATLLLLWLLGTSRLAVR